MTRGELRVAAASFHRAGVTWDDEIVAVLHPLARRFLTEQLPEFDWLAWWRAPNRRYGDRQRFLSTAATRAWIAIRRHDAEPAA
jgi:hypothetical protein